MSTTWKQVVLDTADAYREANGTTDKIPVGQLADKVRSGAGIPYEGDNPLTIGADGYNFPAKTLLKEGLQIINGVNGEDLTDTVADQTVAVEELMKMVNRKLAMNNGEGQYVWKKLTAEGGEFIDFVVSSDTEAYPNGAMQEGYWYELFEEFDLKALFGCTKMAVDTYVSSSRKTLADAGNIHHSLDEIPKVLIILSKITERGTANKNLVTAIQINNAGMVIQTYNTEGTFSSISMNFNLAKTYFYLYASGIFLQAGVEYTIITMA